MDTGKSPFRYVDAILEGHHISWKWRLILDCHVGAFAAATADPDDRCAESSVTGSRGDHYESVAEAHGGKTAAI